MIRTTAAMTSTTAVTPTKATTRPKTTARVILLIGSVVLSRMLPTTDSIRSLTSTAQSRPESAGAGRTPDPADPGAGGVGGETDPDGGAGVPGGWLDMRASLLRDHPETTVATRLAPFATAAPRSVHGDLG